MPKNRQVWCLGVPVAAMFFVSVAAHAVPLKRVEYTRYVREERSQQVVHIQNLRAFRGAENRAARMVKQGRLVTTSLSKLIVPASVPFDASKTAQQYLNQYASTLGVSSAELEEVGIDSDAWGGKHIRYRQNPGVPVFGVEVVVHVERNNMVSAVHGKVAQVSVAKLKLKKAGLSSKRVEAAALGAWQAQYGSAVTPVVRNSGRYIFSPTALGITTNQSSLSYLVWSVDVLPTDEFQATKYLVDAASGEIRYRAELKAMDVPLTRKVYDCSLYARDGVCWSNHAELIDGVTYTFGRREGMPERGPNPLTPFLGCTDVDHLYDRLGDVDQYYMQRFGRDGANMQGGVQVGAVTETHGLTLVDADPSNAGVCPNAAFFFETGDLNFCEGTATLDVVGHEYAHAVNYYSHFAQGGMARVGEARALDESQADFFGEMLERFVGGTTDWVHNTNSPFAPRSLYDPTIDPLPTASGLGGYYPDHYYSETLNCGPSDNSNSAYINMAVMNKASYLMAEGGALNGCAVAGIGADKAEQVMYLASTAYYTVNESFNMAYASILAACSALYPASDCDQVRRALQAVEINQGGLCSGIPEVAPACATECADTDGGQDLSKTGIVTAGDVAMRDTCVMGGMLVETYCDGNAAKRVTVACPNGCVNGECVAG